MALARILVVDDEEPLMAALCHTLGEQGYEAVGAASGKAAVADLRRQKFDLLLTDLMMPEMDGIALLRAALEIDPELAVVLITGEGTISTAVEAMRTGALDYILKPFRLSAILPVLERALSIRKLRLENARLERRIRERAAELEEANQELEAFSYTISHDLRAPLRHVNAFTGILLKQFGAQLHPEARRLLDNVVASGRHMEQLIDDLLSFSRLGRQALSRERVNMSVLAREVLAEFSEGEGRRVDLRVGDLPDCLGDTFLLRQVFVNLLSNAFKFTRKKAEPMIEVGCDRRSECVYFVRDNGAGFDMRYATKLFGVFQRMHSAEEYEGTGAGLSIVQRIIQRHGGRIWAEAEVDKGATFYFTLPPVPDEQTSP